MINASPSTPNTRRPLLRTSRWAALAVAGLILAGCGGDSSDDSADETTSTTAAGSTVSESTDGSEDAETEPSEPEDDTIPDDTTSDDTPEDDASEDDTPSDGDATATGECPLIDLDAAATTLGADITVSAGTDTTCFLEVADGRQVDLNSTVIGIDVDEYASGTEAGCDEGTVEDVEAGDRALACTLSDRSFGFVFVGSSVITVEESFLTDAPVDVATIAALLPDVAV